MPRVMIEIAGIAVDFIMVAILLIFLFIFPFMVLKNILTGKKFISHKT
jgi:hypothetical protein